jgi:hypothetical protein
VCEELGKYTTRSQKKDGINAMKEEEEDERVQTKYLS